MQKIKTLYTFSFPKLTKVEESVETVNEQGETVKVTKKVDKEVPHDFSIIKPSRTLLDEGELFYNVTVSKGVQAGLMNAALLAKRLNNDGGVLSEEEKDVWGNKYVERVKKEIELQRMTVIGEAARTPEEQQAYEKTIKDIAILSREMQEFEIRQQSLFDITAEARARTRTILWWLLQLLYRKDDKGQWVPFFEGETYSDKQEFYDELEDEESYPDAADRQLNARAASHAAKAVTLWYYGRVTKTEEFNRALDEQEKLAATEPAPEEVKPAAE